MSSRVVFIACLALLCAACKSQSVPTPKPVEEAPPANEAAFRDAAVPAPPGYTGPKFKLSADFPKAPPPACTPQTCPWLSVDVSFATTDFDKGGWGKYMTVLRNYIQQGQDPNLPDQPGFVTTVNGATRWYNMPWMSFDLTSGREFVHGCTNERTAFLNDFNGPSAPEIGQHGFPKLELVKSASCQEQNKVGFESWSVGFYNEYGGWALGQAIPRSGEQGGVPQTVTQPSQLSTMKGLPFPEGTLVTKILTTSATPECVPALKNAPVWNVDRHVLDTTTQEYTCARSVQPNHIAQIDVAVVDARAPNRWVYGTFVYNGALPGATFWERMQPLGVQWGSDPGSWPAVQPQASKPLTASSLNPAVNTYQHEGCNGRLAGPVDNALSSCMSCHMAGYAASPVGTPITQGFPPSGNVPPIFGFSGLCPLPDTTSLAATQLSQNNAYFNDYPYPASYPGYTGLISMDSSLQLQVAMEQYAVFNTHNGLPKACTLDKPKN